MKVGEDAVERFRVIAIDGGGNLIDVLGGVVAKVGDRATLNVEDFGRGFFAGFDAGLMIGVDMDERGIEADGAFKERDQGTDGACVNASDGDRHGIAAGFVGGSTGA